MGVLFVCTYREFPDLKSLCEWTKEIVMETDVHWWNQGGILQWLRKILIFFQICLGIKESGKKVSKDVFFYSKVFLWCLISVTDNYTTFLNKNKFQFRNGNLSFQQIYRKTLLSGTFLFLFSTWTIEWDLQAFVNDLAAPICHWHFCRFYLFNKQKRLMQCRSQILWENTVCHIPLSCSAALL